MKHLIAGYGSLLTDGTEYSHCYAYLQNARRVAISNDTRLSRYPVTTIDGIPVQHKLYAGLTHLPEARTVCILFEPRSIDEYDTREFLYQRVKLSTEPSEDIYLDKESLTQPDFLEQQDSIWVYIPKIYTSSKNQICLQPTAYTDNECKAFMDKEYLANIEYGLAYIEATYGLTENNQPFDRYIPSAHLIYPHQPITLVIANSDSLQIDYDQQRLLYRCSNVSEEKVSFITIPLGSTLVVNDVYQAQIAIKKIAEFNRQLPEPYKGKGYQVIYSNEHIIHS